MTIKEYNKSVDKYSDQLYAFALKALQDDDLAKDVVQESFIRLWENKEKIKKNKIKPYLFTIAYHLIIDETRYSKKFESLYFEYKEDEEELNSNVIELYQTNYSYVSNFDIKANLSDAIKTLPDIQQKIIMLRDDSGYSYKEIASLLDLSETQVKVYLHRGRKQVKSVIGKMEDLL
jgi:RNA polymerase sigma-70 factor (ECF subfamily)